jgi:hypothetical protein
MTQQQQQQAAAAAEGVWHAAAAAAGGGGSRRHETCSPHTTKGVPHAMQGASPLRWQHVTL